MICTEATTRMVGQQSVFTATFRDDEGDIVDPATVTFMWRRSGAASEETFEYGTDDEVAKVSSGVYTFTAPPFTAGVGHHVRVKSTSPATAAEATVGVAKSAFSNP